MTPGRGFDACLFDLYDTLVYLDRESHRARTTRIAAMCGVEAKEFVKAWNGLVVESNLGRFPRTEDRVLQTLNLLHRTPEPALAQAIAAEEHRFLREASFLFDDALAVVQGLRRQGLKIAMVTNASPSVREVLRAVAVEPMFDAILVSSECGVRKPDPAIYQEALRRLAVTADRAVFVGDGNDRELEGAKAVGLTTIHVRRDLFRAVESEQSDGTAIDLVVGSLAEIPALLGLAGG